ncbi:hypothetical protein J1614_005014 [Plenodomus biglobosus]|nr:hypothetical protein J1614_005014 [Plenodomus biglobosus]
MHALSPHQTKVVLTIRLPSSATPHSNPNGAHNQLHKGKNRREVRTKTAINTIHKLGSRIPQDRDSLPLVAKFRTIL